jgi:hypothetical protein
MQLNKHSINGMLKYAGIYSGLMTGGFNLAKKGLSATKPLFSKANPDGTRRLSLKRMALTGAGLYGAKKINDQVQSNQKNLQRDYMDDIHPYRQSDTLRMAR